jgi:multidrug resistance efflux pump
MTLTVYLPENQYGLVSIGDSAEVEVDSFPGEVFAAEVVRIADEAEYTPRNVQTEEERQTTVYAVELRVVDPDGRLKPGMPADVIFEVGDLSG